MCPKSAFSRVSLAFEPLAVFEFDLVAGDLRILVTGP